jgi:magnesium-transporting ATPase (P-type)
MEVMEFTAGDSQHKAQDPEINQELNALLESLIVLDSNARLDIDDDKLKYVASGNPVEVAMLNFLFTNHCDVPSKLQTKELKSKQFTFIPFSSRRKRSLVAQQLDETTVRIVVKGAPEFILNCCTAAIDGNAESGDFGEENATEQYGKITEVIEGAQDGLYLNPITYAFKDMSIEDFESLKQENNGFEKEEHRQCLESELTYVATFYLQDGLRDDVHVASDELFMAGINSRIISGDYEATVLKISKAIGLKEEGNESEAMSGGMFREIVTPLVKKVDQGERYSWTFVSDEARRTFKDQIKE